MRLHILVLLILINAWSLELKAVNSSFYTLKNMLNSRQNEAKVYLPSTGQIGQAIKVLVVAPNAKKITLLASDEQGQALYQSEKTRLAPNYFIVGESQSDKANFEMKLDPEKYQKLKNKNLFFEAIVTYVDSDKDVFKTASFYGSNAAFSNYNAVRVVEAAKDHASAAAMARSFIPGLTGQQQRF
jgi:hypothetical protein